eukprot:584365-Pyramimonas_sp.AAC.1
MKGCKGNAMQVAPKAMVVPRQRFASAKPCNAKGHQASRGGNACHRNSKAMPALCQRCASARPMQRQGAPMDPLSSTCQKKTFCGYSTRNYAMEGSQEDCVPPQFHGNACAAPALCQRKANAMPKGAR